MSGPKELKEGSAGLALPSAWAEYRFKSGRSPSLPTLSLSLSDPRQQKEFADLSQEKSPEAYLENLLAFGQRLEDRRETDAALQIYSHIAKVPSPLEGEGQGEGSAPKLAEIQSRAQQRLNALQGSGSTALRAEVLVKNFVHDATDYRMIVPMLAGSLASQAVGSAVFGRLAGTVRPAWWSRGLGAKVISGLAGYAAEVPLFTQLNRSFSGAHSPLGDDLARSALTLGSLKAFGAGGSRLGQAVARRTGSENFIVSAFGQGSAFLGMLSSHRLEEHLGLRPRVDGATTVTDILSSMVSLGVGSHLGHRALGPGFATFQREMSLRAESAGNLSALSKYGIGNLGEKLPTHPREEIVSREMKPVAESGAFRFSTGKLSLTLAGIGSGLATLLLPQSALAAVDGVAQSSFFSSPTFWGLLTSLTAVTVGMVRWKSSPPADVDPALYDAVNSYDWKAPEAERNHVYDVSRERENDNREIRRMNGEVMASGLRLFVEPEDSLGDIMSLLHGGEPILQVGARGVFDSDRWGPVDLRALAAPNPLKYYPGNVRQAELYRDLSILLERRQLDIGRLRSLLGADADKFFLERNWNRVPVTWKHFLWLQHRVDFSAYRGADGYARFAREHFAGDPNRAWMAVRPLFESRREMKRQTAWPMMKKNHLEREPLLARELAEGLEKGHLIGEEGYDLFAASHFEGDSRLAWNAARTLMSREDFRKLEWERFKRTNVFSQETMREHLLKGIADGSLLHEIGYDRFASEYFAGYSNSAWTVAKTLLPAESFALLQWGTAKVTKVQDQIRIRQFLQELIASDEVAGEEGYDAFAREFFRGHSQSAWRAARSLLNEREFLSLGWRPKTTYLHEEEGLRAGLRDGLKNGDWFGEAGLKRYAEQFWSEDQGRAWSVARSVLTEVEFLLLAWESPDHGSEGLGREGGHSPLGLFFGGYLSEQKSPPLEEAVVQRFLNLLAAKPRTLGRRLMRLIASQGIEDVGLQILLHWFGALLEETPHVPRRTREPGEPEKKENGSEPASEEKQPSEPPAPDASFPPEQWAAIQAALDLLKTDPHAGSEALMERIQKEFGGNGAIQVLLAYLQNHLNSVPRKERKPSSNPPSGSSSPSATPPSPPEAPQSEVMVAGDDTSPVVAPDERTPISEASLPSSETTLSDGELLEAFLSAHPDLAAKTDPTLAQEHDFFQVEGLQPISRLIGLLTAQHGKETRDKVERHLWTFTPPSLSATPREVIEQVRQHAESLVRFASTYREELTSGISASDVSPRAEEIGEEVQRAYRGLWELPEDVVRVPVLQAWEVKELIAKGRNAQPDENPGFLLIKGPKEYLYQQLEPRIYKSLKGWLQAGKTYQFNFVEEGYSISSDQIISLEEAGAFFRIVFGNLFALPERTKALRDILEIELRTPSLADVKKAMDQEERKAGALLLLGADPAWVRAVLAKRQIQLYQINRERILDKIQFSNFVLQFPEVQNFPPDRLVGARKLFLRALLPGSVLRGNLASEVPEDNPVIRVFALLKQVERKKPDLLKPVMRDGRIKADVSFNKLLRIYIRNRKEILPLLTEVLPPQTKPTSEIIALEDSNATLAATIGELPEIRGDGPPLTGQEALLRLWNFVWSKEWRQPPQGEILTRSLEPHWLVWIQKLALSPTGNPEGAAPGEDWSPLLLQRMGEVYLAHRPYYLKMPELVLEDSEKSSYPLADIPQAWKLDAEREFPEIRILLEDSVSTPIHDWFPSEYAYAKIWTLLEKLESVSANKEFFQKNPAFVSFAATARVYEASRWVDLKNAHLAKAWTPNLLNEYRKFRPKILELLARSEDVGMDRLLATWTNPNQPAAEPPPPELAALYGAGVQAMPAVMRALQAGRTHPLPGKIQTLFWKFEPPPLSADSDKVLASLVLPARRIRDFALDNLAMLEKDGKASVALSALDSVERDWNEFWELQLNPLEADPEAEWRQTLLADLERGRGMPANKPGYYFYYKSHTGGKRALVLKKEDAEAMREAFQNGEEVRFQFLNSLNEFQPEQLISLTSFGEFHRLVLATLLLMPMAAQRLYFGLRTLFGDPKMAPVQVEMGREARRAAALIILGADPEPVRRELAKNLFKIYRFHRLTRILPLTGLYEGVSALPEIVEYSAKWVVKVTAEILANTVSGGGAYAPSLCSWILENETYAVVYGLLALAEARKPGLLNEYAKGLKNKRNPHQFQREVEALLPYYLKRRPEILSLLQLESSGDRPEILSPAERVDEPAVIDKKPEPHQDFSALDSLAGVSSASPEEYPEILKIPLPPDKDFQSFLNHALAMGSGDDQMQIEINRSLWNWNMPANNATASHVAEVLQIYRAKIYRKLKAGELDIVAMTSASGLDPVSRRAELRSEIDPQFGEFWEMDLPNGSQRTMIQEWVENYRKDANQSLLEARIGDGDDALLFHQILPNSKMKEVKRQLKQNGKFQASVHGTIRDFPKKWVSKMEGVQPFFILGRALLSQISEPSLIAYYRFRPMSRSSAEQEAQAANERDLSRATCLVLMGADPELVMLHYERRLLERYREARNVFLERMDWVASAKELDEVRGIEPRVIAQSIENTVAKVPQENQAELRNLFKADDLAIRIVCLLLGLERLVPGKIDKSMLKIENFNEESYRAFTAAIVRYYLERRAEFIGAQSVVLAANESTSH